MIREILDRIAQMQINMENIYDKLKVENEELQNKLDEIMKIRELNVKINELEQYTRRDTIEIYGIEKKENENFENI